MALIDKYAGKAPNKDLIAKYVGKKPKKRGSAAILIGQASAKAKGGNSDKQN